MADPGKGPGRLGPRKKMFGDPPPYLKVWIRHWIIPSNSHALCVSLLRTISFLLLNHLAVTRLLDMIINPFNWFISLFKILFSPLSRSLTFRCLLVCFLNLSKSLKDRLRQMMQHFLVSKCKRRNEFAEWHVAWLAERYNYAEYKICKMAQRNKFYWKACARRCCAFFFLAPIWVSNCFAGPFITADSNQQGRVESSDKLSIRFYVILN